MKILSNTSSLQLRINLMFLALTVALEGLMITYWIWVLEPQVMEKVKISAFRMAQSQAHLIVDALSYEETATQKKEVISAMDKMMVLKDPETGSSYTKGIEVNVNCSVLETCDGEYHFNRGDNACGECFTTEVPLFSQNTNEPLGFARIYNSNEFFRHFKNGIKSMFFTGAAVGFGLLLITWFMLNKMLFRIKVKEEDIQEKQAQIIHAGRLAAMGEMAAGIAHEINQPLSIIRIAADGLKPYFHKYDKDSMEKTAVSSIIDQVERTSVIIDHMRSFVRVGSETAEKFDIVVPIKAALSFFKEQFRIHQISLQTDLPETAVEIRINPHRFEQVIVNLVSNARHAVDRKEQILGGYEKKVNVTLGFENDSNSLFFDVMDNGIGMSPEVLDRCLEPFFTTKEVGEGTGIGLSVVNSIVRENKMVLKVTSHENVGSTFRISFNRDFS